MFASLEMKKLLTELYFERRRWEFKFILTAMKICFDWEKFKETEVSIYDFHYLSAEKNVTLHQCCNSISMKEYWLLTVSANIYLDR